MTLPANTADFDYNLVMDANYGAGQIHNGFRRIANELWDGGFKDILDREFVWGHGVNRHLTINGHSLGGGTAKLLVARAEVSVQALWLRVAPDGGWVQADTYAAQQ